MNVKDARNTAAADNWRDGEAEPARGLSIAAVVVTYNRFALLQENIAALREQTRAPDEIIVVNNGSTDSTAAWLAQQKDLTVVTQENLGSSGGQYAGIKTAFQRGHDWFWCMDDDTIPNRDALECLLRCPRIKERATGFLGSLVLAADGELFAESYFVPSHPADWCRRVVEDHCVRVTVSSFVSLLVSRNAVSAVGLPIKEIFIIFDDTEFTRRLSRPFKGYCVLDSIVLHKTARPILPPPNARAFNLKHLYALRNEVYLARTADMGSWGKFLALINLCYINMRAVAMRKRPLSALRWFWMGLRFRPAIEYVHKTALIR